MSPGLDPAHRGPPVRAWLTMDALGRQAPVIHPRLHPAASRARFWTFAQRSRMPSYTNAASAWVPPQPKLRVPPSEEKFGFFGKEPSSSIRIISSLPHGSHEDGVR